MRFLVGVSKTFDFFIGYNNYCHVPLTYSERPSRNILYIYVTNRVRRLLVNCYDEWGLNKRNMHIFIAKTLLTFLPFLM